MYKEGQSFNGYIKILYNFSDQELVTLSDLELSFPNEKIKLDKI